MSRNVRSECGIGVRRWSLACFAAAFLLVVVGCQELPGGSGLVPVSSVAVTPRNASIEIGEMVQLAAELRDAGGRPLVGREVTWSSMDPGIATVSSGGLVAGLAAGTGSIRVSHSSGSPDRVGSVVMVAYATVVVLPPPAASVTVAPESASLEVDGSVQLSAQVRDAEGRLIAGAPVAWTTSGSGIAAVGPRGFVVAQAPGTATITAASGAVSGTATIVVTPPPPAASVTVTPVSASLEVDRSVQLSAQVRDAEGRLIAGAPVVWTTSSSSIATVGASGFVVARAPGTATITAASGVVSGTATITVVPKPSVRDPDGYNARYTVDASCNTSVTVSFPPGSTSQYDTGPTWQARFYANVNDFVYVSSQVRCYNGSVRVEIQRWRNGGWETFRSSSSSGSFVIATASGSFVP
jgi:uncharacterized protein YjdB